MPTSTLMRLCSRRIDDDRFWVDILRQLHLGWDDLEDPLPSEGHVAEVGIGIDGQVDDALDAPMAGEIEGVVEDAGMN